MVLLDINAAFVANNILINKLHIRAGISGIALDWFLSYSFSEKIMITIGDRTSSCAHLSCGVLQGSILGPI